MATKRKKTVNTIRHPSARQLAACVVTEFLLRAEFFSHKNTTELATRERGGIEVRIGRRKFREIQAEIRKLTAATLAQTMKIWNDFLDPSPFRGKPPSVCTPILLRNKKCPNKPFPLVSQPS